MPDHVKGTKESSLGRGDKKIKEPEARKMLGLFKEITEVRVTEGSRLVKW